MLLSHHKVWIKDSLAANFLLKVLESAVVTTIESEPVAIPILLRFNGVQDSSVTTLPDCMAVIWSGCGGSSPKNTSSSIKTQVRIDLNTGKLMYNQEESMTRVHHSK